MLTRYRFTPEFKRWKSEFVWTALQSNETCEYIEQPPRFLIVDRNSKFSASVVSTVKAVGPQPTAFRSPWRNGIAERWIGSLRRELLDHVIVLNRRHLRRLLNEYVRTTRIELTSDLGRTLLGVAFQPSCLRAAIRLSPCHDSSGCIIAILSRPKQLPAPNSSQIAGRIGARTASRVLALRSPA